MRMAGVIRLIKKLIPFFLRVEVLRLRRYADWLIETPTIARSYSEHADVSGYQHILAQHNSPLERVPGATARKLQRGKEHNIATAVKRLNGLIVHPFEVFSFHRVVGRPSRLRGFRPGLELRNGKPSTGIGGGCCAISNMLYWLALRSGMSIVERHRHCLDLFPDNQRTVPFGCGATVFYNYADLRFENPLDQPVLLCFWIDNKYLHGELRCLRDPGWLIEVYETGHRFFVKDRVRFRENYINRRIIRTDSQMVVEQEVAHNIGQVLYSMEESQ